jgi:uroporphyrinogen-III synthase
MIRNIELILLVCTIGFVEVFISFAGASVFTCITYIWEPPEPTAQNLPCKLIAITAAGTVLTGFAQMIPERSRTVVADVFQPAFIYFRTFG